jgi:AraC family transcriptional regulator
VGISFAPPRLERFGPLVLAGTQKSHRLGRDRMDLYRDVAAQWRALAVVADGIPALAPRRGHGVGLHMADGATALDYFCGFVVSGQDHVPAGLSAFEIPPMTCAVFEHYEHVSLLRSTMELIFATVLPMAGIEAADESPIEFIQRYGACFEPATGLGGIDVLVPVEV